MFFLPISICAITIDDSTLMLQFQSNLIQCTGCRLPQSPKGGIWWDGINALDDTKKKH